VGGAGASGKKKSKKESKKRGVSVEQEEQEGAKAQSNGDVEGGEEAHTAKKAKKEKKGKGGEDLGAQSEGGLASPAAVATLQQQGHSLPNSTVEEQKEQYDVYCQENGPSSDGKVRALEPI